MFHLEKETPTHYVVKHPRGDVLRIAKHGLSQEMHSHIKKLAEGGKVEAQDKRKQVEEGFNNALGLGYGKKQQSEQQPQTPPEPKKYFDGTPEEPVQEDNPSSQPAQQAPVVINVGGAQQPQAQPQQAMPPQVQQPQQVAALEPSATRQPASEPQAAPAPAFGNVPVKRAATPSPRIDTTGVPDHGREMNENINRVKQGAEQQAQAETAIGKEAQTAYGQQQTKLADLTSNIDTHWNFIRGEQEKIAKEIGSGEVDFNKVWHESGTGKQILAAIGIALGGAASGVTGGPNMALKVIDDAIDRDIAAQKHKTANKRTALSAYNEMMQNDMHASMALKPLYEAATMAQINKMTSGQAGQLAQSKKNLLLGTMLPSMQKNAYDFALNKAQSDQIFGGGGKQQLTQGEQGVDPKMAIRFSHLLGASEKEKSKMYEEYDSLSKMKKSGEDLLNAFDEVKNMALHGALSPNKVAALIEPKIAQLSKDSAGRYTEQDARALKEMMIKQISLNPLHFNVGDWGDTLDLKRKEVAKFISQKMQSSLLDSYRIPAPKIRTAELGE
jgi:hypothetical protein